MSHRIFRLLMLAILVNGLVAVKAPSSARAAGPWYVSTAGSDANDCLSPATSCATINGAINKASSGDTVLVAEGPYTATDSEVVFISKDLTLSGGWNTTFTTQSGKSTIDGEGLRRGIQVNGFPIIVTIENFIVQNCFTAYFQAPGAIFLYGTLTLRNSIIQNNQTTGLYYDAPGTTLALHNSAIINNTSPDVLDDPGGLHIKNTGGVTISNSVISGNSGSGIVNESGVLTITDSAITNNNGAVWGAGIKNFGSLTIDTSTISNNLTATGPNIFGGGVYNAGSLIISNSTISSNISNEQGGGIYQSSGNLTINSSTISANSAISGGGIYHNDGTVTLRNTILAGNLAQIDGPDCWNSIGSAGYNLLGNTSSCNLATTTGDLTNINPLLEPLLDNGGPTFTHALLPGSPAIDAGNPAGCRDQNNNALTTDQRGVARPQGGRCDIGAFELEAETEGIQVSIDITPGTSANVIYQNVLLITVAILSADGFDAVRDVDRSSLTFGKTGDETSLNSCLNKQGRDVNGDGRGDLICYFRLSLTGIVLGDLRAILRGQTLNGTAFEGADTINVRPRPPKK